MSITQLLKKIIPFIQPYKKIIVFTFILTLLGSFAAQVNAFILRYTVDSISDLMVEKKALKDGFNLLLFISLILFSKEMLNALIQFGQKFYGEKLRIFISRDLSQAIIEKILTYRLAFYNSTENDSGKLQTRIDLGISSLTRLIQNFFIDILPLFTNAIVALSVMFYANFYVGLVGLIMIPFYFWVSNLQAKKLSGFRRNMRTYRESKSSRDRKVIMARVHSKKAEIEKLQRLVIAIDGVVNYLPLIGYTMRACGATYREIGEAFGVSRQMAEYQVKEIEKALDK